MVPLHIENPSKDFNAKAKRRRLKALVVFGFLVILVFAFLLFERARGAIALGRRINQLSASGERLNLDVLIPTPRPFDSNAAIVVLSITNELRQTFSLVDSAPPSLRYAAPAVAVVTWRLKEWSSDKKTNRWSDIESQIASASNVIFQLHAVADKPYFDAGLDYKKGFVDLQIGPAAEVKKAAQLLNIAATYELSRQDAEAAHHHLRTLIGLSQQTTEPLIIWQLVRQACVIISINTLWQFLQHPSITEEQLALLQSALGKADFERDMAVSLEMERAMSLDFFSQVKSSSAIRAQVIAQREGWEEPFNSFLTEGWLLRYINVPLWRFSWADQDELRLLNRWQAVITLERQARSNGWASVTGGENQSYQDVLDPALAEFSGESEASSFTRFRFLFSSGPFGVSEILVRKTMALQTYRNLAMTAIALKRFELRNGELPQKLDALVPHLLPGVLDDRMIDQPLQYERLNRTEFLLYSVGENGVNEHGDGKPAPERTFLQIWDGRDGVWPKAATSAQAVEAMKRRH